MNSQLGSHQSSWKQWLAVLAATSVMLSNTFDTVWATRRRYLGWGPQVLANTSFIIIGSFLGAIFADIYGRKKTLLLTSIFVIPRIVSLNLHTENWNWINELFMDIGSGITCTVVPLYICEIANTNIRGALMVLQLAVFIFGVFVFQIVVVVLRSYHILHWIGIVNNAILIIPTSFHVIVLGIFPETPDYLNWKRRYNEAAQSLAFFKGVDHVEARGDEIWINPQSDNEGQCWKQKVLEIVRFENRRSLAMIFSIIAIKWSTGQQRNEFGLIRLMPKSIGGNFQYFLIGIWALKLISTVCAMPMIRILGRKLSLMVVILLSCIATIILVTPLGKFNWILIGCLLVPILGHFLLTAVELDYIGNFFSINIRAIAIAIVISFEVLVRNATFTVEERFYPMLLMIPYFITAIALFLGFFFVWIFFPKNTNVPAGSEISQSNEIPNGVHIDRRSDYNHQL